MAFSNPPLAGANPFSKLHVPSSFGGAVGWLLFVCPSVTYAAVAPNDFLLLAELSHRIPQSQILHVDFQTPLGWLSSGESPKGK